VGAADFVFFGEVWSSSPGDPQVFDGEDDPGTNLDGQPDWYPQTEHVVHPVGDIKGNLTSSQWRPAYTVIQEGGIGADGALNIFDGDAILGVEGTYLLAVRIEATSCGGALMGQSEMSTSSSCPPSVLRLFAPGYDNENASDPATRAALAQRYGGAYANQVNPFPLAE
jgi:hypothetical protein